MQENRAGKLNTNQNKAIKALLTTNTRAEAARVTGICERTLYKYLADPIFRIELLEQEQILRRDAGRRLAKDTNHVINLLFDFIEKQEQVDAGVWLRAVSLWLDHHYKTQEQSDLERRVTRLEVRAER